MRALLDNNLPPALAHALHELSNASEAVPVFHLTDRFEKTAADADWLNTLGAEGNWIVVSHDKFRKGKLEMRALQRSGVKAFILEKAWSNHRFWEKSYNLVRWWPAILEQAQRAHGSLVLLVPWQFSGKGKFKQPLT